MKPIFDLTDNCLNTSFAPLCVVGQALWERDDLEILRQFNLIDMQTRDHTPGEKLLRRLAGKRDNIASQNNICAFCCGECINVRVRC